MTKLDKEMRENMRRLRFKNGTYFQSAKENYGLIAVWQADLKDLLKTTVAIRPGLSQRVDTQEFL
jgi:hypothetical protein